MTHRPPTPADLRRMEARARAGTPPLAPRGRQVLDVDQRLVAQFLREPDAALFAHAREDVLRLVSETRRLRAALARVRELLAEGMEDEAWMTARDGGGGEDCPPEPFLAHEGSAAAR
jgi:hypothetical protein